MTTQGKEGKNPSPLKEKLNKTLLELKEVFSLANLTVSLFSVLMVIGISYGSGEISKLMQNKFYSNPTMYLIFTLIVFMSYFLAILGPAIVYAVKTKKWTSIVYIILLEIVWFSIFVGVLYYTTPEKELDYSDYMLQ
jgi:general stress protein CsbA